MPFSISFGTLHGIHCGLSWAIYVSSGLLGTLPGHMQAANDESRILRRSRMCRTRLDPVQLQFASRLAASGVASGVDKCPAWVGPCDKTHHGCRRRCPHWVQTYLHEPQRVWIGVVGHRLGIFVFAVGRRLSFYIWECAVTAWLRG